MTCNYVVRAIEGYGRFSTVQSSTRVWVASRAVRLCLKSPDDPESEAEGEAERRLDAHPPEGSRERRLHLGQALLDLLIHHLARVDDAERQRADKRPLPSEPAFGLIKILHGLA